MKLLIDMNLSPRWADLFHENGIEASHWSSLGHAAAPDSEIMAHARLHEFIVLTRDLDFGVLLALTDGAKPSVIQLRTLEVSPDMIGALVLRAVRHLALELEEGAVLTIDPKRTRLRQLPMGKQDRR